MSIEKPNEKGSIEQIYENARSKAELFLENIDPALNVEVSSVVVTPKDGEEYNAIVLRFTHNEDPSIKWTMEVEDNDDYLNNEFEKAVRTAYERRRGSLN